MQNECSEAQSLNVELKGQVHCCERTSRALTRYTQLSDLERRHADVCDDRKRVSKLLTESERTVEERSGSQRHDTNS